MSQITTTNASAATTAQRTYIFPKISFNIERSLDQNATMLSNAMTYERDAHGLSGFRFIYSDEEWTAHSRKCNAFQTSCYDMMRAAHYDKKSVQLFRNMNGELAAKLI